MVWARNWVHHRLAQLLGHQTAFALTRWGIGRSVATLLARVGTQKIALGAVATGATGLHLHQNTKERHTLGGDVLASGQEVEWLNAAIRPIWEHLNAGFRRLIEDEIQPALQKRLGVVGSYISFTKLSLGQSAPRFGPVRVTRSSHGLEINVGFCLEGNGLIEFSTGVASIQVSNITVEGTLRVGLHPLVDSLNPVGGISVTCLDRPTIDLTIKAGSEFIPNLYNFVRDTVDDVVASLLVMPNVIAIPLARLWETFGPVTDACAIRHPAPLGYLRVRLEGVSSAAALPSGLYVEMMIGCSSWKSSVCRAKQDPNHAEWPEDAAEDFAVHSHDQSIRLRLYSSSSFGAVLLGTARVFIHDLAAGRVEVPLMDAGTEDAAETRSVELELLWSPVREEPPAKASVRPRLAGAPPAEGFVLASIHLHRVSNVQSDRKHKVHVKLGAADYFSEVGSAPPELVHQIADDVLLELALKLCGKLPLADFSDALGVSVDHARDFAREVERRRRSGAAGTASGGHLNGSWQSPALKAWAAVVMVMTPRVVGGAQQEWQTAGIAAGVSVQGPDFNEKVFRVCHLRAKPSDPLMIELVGEDGSSTARFDADLGSVVQQGGFLEGPFQLRSPDGMECTLHGHIRLRRLEAPVRRDRVQDFSGKAVLGQEKPAFFPPPPRPENTEDPEGYISNCNEAFRRVITRNPKP
ncbi:esyt3 [Symbiodinium natans]|uniref:Esyt3 protein n=1 Tax=Symbiodinium natans TaxID=878477 RepID=A0A812I6T9_9DINO|nr:esyt3 [Symbiodinium natans]